MRGNVHVRVYRKLEEGLNNKVKCYVHVHVLVHVHVYNVQQECRIQIVHVHLLVSSNTCSFSRREECMGPP